MPEKRGHIADEMRKAGSGRMQKLIGSKNI